MFPNNNDFVMSYGKSKLNSNLTWNQSCNSDGTNIIEEKKSETKLCVFLRASFVVQFQKKVEIPVLSRLIPNEA